MARKCWLLACLGGLLVSEFGGQAVAQSVFELDFHGAKVFGTVEIADGCIELADGAAMILTTSSFGFVPSGGQRNEYGAPGVPEYGDNAIHDAIVEGANYANGFWNGTNGIVSLDAQNQPEGLFAIGWLDNSLGFYSSWYGVPVGRNQTIIATTWVGDANLDGIVNSDDYGFWSNTVSSNPQQYLYGGTGPEWVDGDFDYSGQVDKSDYRLWEKTILTPDANYNLGFSPQLGPVVPAVLGGGAENLVVGQGWPAPEPGSLVLLMLAAVCLAGLRAVRGKLCKLLVWVACFLAPSLGGQALAQPLLVLDYHAPKVFGTVDIAGGAIDITSGAMIVTTSSFGFVPSGGQPDELGTPGIPEYGDDAIHDAIVEGANFADGYWNGTNGIMSSYVQNCANGTLAIGWIDNAYVDYTSWWGVPVKSTQSIIVATWTGDAMLDGVADNRGYENWESSILNPGCYWYGGTKPDWIDGDFNYDGRVDSDDYGLWSNTVTTPGANYNFGFDPDGPVNAADVSSASRAPANISVGNWPVPEPAGITLLAFAAACMAVYLGGRSKRRAIAACLIAAALLAAPSAASAAIYLNAVVDSATPGCAANVSNNGYTYAVNSADQNTTVILDVYAVIKDASPSRTADGLTKLAGNFYLSDQALVGDVGFNSWGAQINTLASDPSDDVGVPEFQWSLPWGGLALGGTSASDPNASDWWVASENNINQTGGKFVGPTGGTQATASGAIGTEFYLGQLTVDFSGYALPAASTTAQLLSTPRTGSEVQGKPYQWSEAGVAQNTYGTAAAVACGSGNLLSLFPLDFVYSYTYYPGQANLSALSLGGTRVMAGGSLSVSSSLMNTAYSGTGSQQDTLASWTVGGAGGFSAQSGTNLAASGAVAIGPLTYTSGATTGLTTITLTSSGTGANGTGVVAGSSTSSIAVLGNRVVLATSAASPLIHLGQAIAPQTITLSTAGDDCHFTRVSVNNAGPDANGLSVGGGANPLFSGPAVTDTRTLSGTPGSAGVISGTIVLAVNGEGLPGENPVPVSVNYSGAVFSGSAAWYGGSGSWGGAGTNSNWTDMAAAAIQAAPGVWGFNGDVATLGAGTAGTITLDGPVTLGALTFNNSAAAYALASGSGGTLYLNNGAGTASLTVAAGNHSISAPLVLDTNATVLVSNPANTLTLSGPVGGSGSLTKNGAGTLMLSGSNSDGSSININAGTLVFGTSAALGSAGANVSVNYGAVAAAGYPMDQNFLNCLVPSSSGVAALAADSGNALSLAGFAELRLGAIGQANYSGTLSPSGTTYFLGGGGGALTVSGPLSGANGLDVGTNGTPGGTVVLAGAMTYTGTTAVSGGTLVVQGTNASSSFTANNGGTLVFSGANINLGSAFVRAMSGGLVEYQNANVTYGFLRGPGMQVLAAGSANSFNATTINTGAVVQQQGSAAFLDVTNRGQIVNAAPLTWDGGINDGGSTLTVGNTATVSEWANAGAVVVANGGVFNNHETDLTCYGGGQITVNSGGTLNADSQDEGVALDLQDSLLVNDGVVTGTTNVGYLATVSGSGHFGPVNVSQGGMLVVSAGASPAASSLAVSGGSIMGAGQSSVAANIGGADLVAPNRTDRLVLSGDLTGSGAIDKLGPGTLVLSGSNSYMGGTIVEGGTLIAATPAAIADGTDLTVGSAALLDFAPLTAAQASAPSSLPEPSTWAIAAAGAAIGLSLAGAKRSSRALASCEAR